MTVECKVCNQKFKKLITNTHLKRHNMTTHDYKKKYGEDSLSSDEYRKERSLKYSGKNNPMYGRSHTEETRQKQSELAKQRDYSHLPGVNGQPFTDEHKKNLREAMVLREEKYKSGELTRPEQYERTPELRKRIAEGVKKYAEENKEELSERAKRAYETRVKNGNWKNPYDLMIKKDEDGSVYEAWKEKTSKGLEKGKKIRSKRLKEELENKLKSINISIIDEKYEELGTAGKRWIYTLKCHTCNDTFSFQRQYFVDHRFNEKTCPTCYPRDIKRSQAEKEIAAFVKSLGIPYKRNNRSVLGDREIDLYIPSLSMGIEYNGLYWHSEKLLEGIGKHKQEDSHKKERLKEKDIRLITVFEDEWIHKQNIVKSMLKHRLGVAERKIHARKCEIKELYSKVANDFIRENHIQGVGRSNARYGMYHEDELVAVMTCSTNNISRKVKGWEIDRFCAKLDTNVIGAGGKLFKRFINDHDPEQVISFADRRWSDGKLYETLGFEWSHNTSPNYWYFRPNELIRKHRYGLRKNKDDDPNLTEYENRLKQGYLRIWDCGSSKWIWKKK